MLQQVTGHHVCYQSTFFAPHLTCAHVSVAFVPPQEASIAWEKRQAEVRAKVQQESDANAWNTWWDSVAGESTEPTSSVMGCTCGRVYL